MGMRANTMVLLSDSVYLVIDPDQDVRGRKVLDRDGNEIGEVDDLIIDGEQKVRLLRVKHGGLFGVGATPLFIPVEAIARVTGEEVAVSRSRVQMAAAPQYDPTVVDGDSYFAELYRYYG